MNHMRRSRLSGIALLLIVPLILVGCTPELLCDFCRGSCAIVCSPFLLFFYPPMVMFYPYCVVMCMWDICTICEGTTSFDEWAAIDEELQLAAIEFCRE